MHDEMAFLKIRGLLRNLVLYTLKDGPLHGYGVMKRISELFQFNYTPSPGIIYPTLHLLEDMGLIRSRVEGRRRIYELTEEGKRVLDANMEEIDEFLGRIRYVRELIRELGIIDLIVSLKRLFETFTSLPSEVKVKLRRNIEDMVEAINKAIETAKTAKTK